MNKNKRYLVYNFKEYIESEGLDVYLGVLSQFFILSFLLDRVPVITGFYNNTEHNFDLPKRVVQFQNYVDLSKTQIFKIQSDKIIDQVASSLQWVSEQDFDLQSFPEEQVGYVHVDMHDFKDLSKLSEAESYTVLCIKYKRIENEIRIGGSVQAYPARTAFPYFVLLQPSQIVEDLTDIVLNCFGTNRNDTISLKDELTKQPRIGRRIVREVMQSKGSFYACMHVRRKYLLHHSSYYFSSFRKQIKKAIQVANLGYGTKLYIMSDIHDPKYLDFLKPDYQVYRYHDFPELQRLVTGEADSVDNYMLYSVEKNIMSYALIQILPPGSSSLTFPLDASYRVPFLIKMWWQLRYRIPVALKDHNFNFQRSVYLRINLILEKVGLRKHFSDINNRCHGSK